MSFCSLRDQATGLTSYYFAAGFAAVDETIAHTGDNFTKIRLATAAVQSTVSGGNHGCWTPPHDVPALKGRNGTDSRPYT